MFLKEDRLDSKIFQHGIYKTRRYKHLCKDCNKELWLTPYEEKNHAGHCGNCGKEKWGQKRRNLVYKDNQKWCKGCNRYLDLSKFIKVLRKTGKSHLRTMCRKCERLEYLGINALKHEEMVNSQNNQCAICLEPGDNFQKGLFVDHNHSTGKVRSLLCPKCNTAIGLMKESEELLQKAINYLKLHNKAYEIQNKEKDGCSVKN